MITSYGFTSEGDIYKPKHTHVFREEGANPLVTSSTLAKRPTIENEKPHFHTFKPDEEISNIVNDHYHTI